MRLDLLPTEPFARDQVAEAGAEKTYSLLVVRDGESSTYPLGDSGKLLIGRSTSADLRIDHASVSREHAALHLGESLRIEDLESANGTRVRDLPLQPGVAVEVFPDDVIDLGAVLLVVQYRRIEQRLRRSCVPAFFQLRVEEECERSLRQGGQFALTSLEVDGGLGSHAIQLLLASELHDEDLITSSAPGKYDLLWPNVTLADAEKRLEISVARLGQRGLHARAQLKHFPRDGQDVADLFGRPAGTATRPPLERGHAGGFVVVDEAMRRVHKLLARIADSELSVVLLGETGVGKELCAELLHGSSARSGKPLSKLNCAAVSEASLESELFGQSDDSGLLEAASGGTLFLDEVGGMPLATQIKLVRALEAREVLRIGARSPRPIDVRIIAATHQDLNERITHGLFREDLYYRLNGISVLVPPLRERIDDIEPLARHFLELYAKAERPPPSLSESSIDLLEAYTWPGNVRELRNAMERALVLCEGPVIEPAHLPLDRSREALLPNRPAQRASDLRSEVKTLERERIERALLEHQGNQRRAAEALGLSRGALLRRLDLLGITRPRKGN